MQKIDLDPFRQYLISRIKRGVINGQKLYWEIKDRGFKGSYETLYRYLRNELSDYWIKPYKKSHFYYKRAGINLSRYKSAKRVETGPGEQAQVDWGHFKTVLVNGKKKKLYCFVYVLGYSRATYIEFTTSEKLPVFEGCHINAFKILGIPNSIVYDNTKTAVLFNKKSPEGTRKIGLNLNFFDFARYYGFEIIASHPYWPRDKGKVEAGVKYVRNNFMQGVKFTKSISSLEELNKQANDWINNIANQRIHATTKARPKDRWLREKYFLKFPNGLPDYQTSPILVRFSTKDQFVQYKQNFYSVPKQYAWRKLFIREINLQGNKLVNIYFRNELVTFHNLCPDRGKSIENPSHFQKDIEPANIKMQMKLGGKHIWKNYPEIPVRPKKLVFELASCRYIENATNIAFLGPTGVGKTHLASALGREAIYAGFDVRFLSLRSLNELIDKVADNPLQLRRLMNTLTRPKVLILDEIALFEPNDSLAKFLVELLLNRHLKSSTIFTSNKTFKSWVNAFGDTHTSAMVLDRITQRMEIIDIEGPSYRIKDRLKIPPEKSYGAAYGR